MRTITTMTLRRATLAGCQRSLARLYRERARERIARARQTAVHARQAVVDEALVWRSFANNWARKAREGLS